VTPAPNELVLFDFGQPDAVPWLPIDDAVMGGVSHSEMRIENGRAVFAGVVSLDFGGGFASVRSNPGALDLSAFTGIEALLRGDGRRYKLILKSNAGLDGVNWQAPFQTRCDERQMVRIPFQDLAPVYRGSRVSNTPPFDALRIATFGFLISDKQAGLFRLEIESILAYH
jgi:NADH dehydrogenase [ubiquinone] 1 alpha subcomplex assembly factor 1